MLHESTSSAALLGQGEADPGVQCKPRPLNSTTTPPHQTTTCLSPPAPQGGARPEGQPDERAGAHGAHAAVRPGALPPPQRGAAGAVAWWVAARGWVGGVGGHAAGMRAARRCHGMLGWLRVLACVHGALGTPASEKPPAPGLPQKMEDRNRELGRSRDALLVQVRGCAAWLAESLRQCRHGTTGAAGCADSMPCHAMLPPPRSCTRRASSWSRPATSGASCPRPTSASGARRGAAPHIACRARVAAFLPPWRRTATQACLPAGAAA